MRRTVATLLVVTSPLLLATPVSASADRLPVQAAAAAVVPAAPAPIPARPAPALTPPAAPPAVRHAVRALRRKAPAAATDVNDAAYAARLQAELCQARQIFCGLDRNGRYPAS